MHVIFNSIAIVVSTWLATWWMMDNWNDLVDRSPPYTRTPDRVFPVDPTACGLPSGPTPTFVRIADCVTAVWKTEFHRHDCRVWPLFPFVVRRLTDAAGDTIELPTVRSQFSVGVMQQVAGQSLGNKVFIQPAMLGEAAYNADIRYVCPLRGGMDNPIDWLFPRLVVSDPIRYQVSER